MSLDARIAQVEDCKHHELDGNALGSTMRTGTDDTGTKHFIGRGIRQRFVGREESGVKLAVWSGNRVISCVH
eukprot:scaffold51837_cov56-Attheya_sp.AAC.4